MIHHAPFEPSLDSVGHTLPPINSSSRGTKFHRGPRPHLSRRIWRLLTYGDEHGSYGHDAFRVVGAILAEAARAGYDFEQLRGILESPQNLGGEWYGSLVVKRGLRYAERELERQFIKAVGVCREPLSDATDARVVAYSLQQDSLSWEWPGRSGATRAKVYIAHTTIALQAGSLTYRASARQLAERAGVSRPIAQKRSRELCEQHLLRRVEPGKVTQSTTWKLVQGTRGEALPVGPTSQSSNTGLCLHAAFRYGTGLDGRVWRVLDADEPQTANEVAAIVRMPVATVRRKLRRLANADLATRDLDGGWCILNTPGLLDHIASITGMTERADRQRKRHAHERTQYRASLNAGGAK